MTRPRPSHFPFAPWRLCARLSAAMSADLATLVTALPVLILFFAFARKIIDSIGYSGSK